MNYTTENEVKDIKQLAGRLNDDAERWLDDSYRESIKAPNQRGRKVVEEFKRTMLLIEGIYNKQEPLRELFEDYVNKSYKTLLVSMRQSIAYEDINTLGISGLCRKIEKISITLTMMTDAFYNGQKGLTV